MTDQRDDFFSAVELADRAPVVASRYGFRKETFDDKTFLVPLTRDEFVVVLASHRGITQEAAKAILDDEDSGRRHYCYFKSDHSCVSKDGCSKCRKSYETNSWFCNCVE